MREREWQRGTEGWNGTGEKGESETGTERQREDGQR